MALTSAERVAQYEWGYAGTISYMGKPVTQVSTAVPTPYVKVYKAGEPTKVPTAVKETPTEVSQTLQKSQDWSKYPPTSTEQAQVALATGYQWNPISKTWARPSYGVPSPYQATAPTVGYGVPSYGPPSPYRVPPVTKRLPPVTTDPGRGYTFTEEQKQQWKEYTTARREYMEAGVATRGIIPMGIQAVSWERLAGIGTAWQLAETPFYAYAAMREKKTTYQEELQSQLGALQETWHEERIAKQLLYEKEPEKFWKREALGLGVSMAAVSMPYWLPKATGIVTKAAPAGFVSLVKVPLGVGVATYGGLTAAMALPKIKARKPGATMEFAVGAGLVGAGAYVGVSGLTEWLSLRGKQLQRMPIVEDIGVGKEREIWRGITPKMTATDIKKWKMEYKLGTYLRGIGEAPTRLKEWIWPPKYQYWTKETRGFETAFEAFKRPTGEYYGGGAIMEGEVIGGRWYPSGRGIIGDITELGGKRVSMRPVQFAYYKGLPESAKAFDVIGFFGGELAGPSGATLESIPSITEIHEATTGKYVRGVGQMWTMEKPTVRFEVPILGEGPPSRAYPYWTEDIIISKGKGFLQDIETFISPDDMFQQLVEKYPQKMLRDTGLKGFVGAEQFITEDLIKTIPEDTGLRGAIAARFVKGPRVYEPYKIQAPSGAPSMLDYSGHIRQDFMKIMKELSIPVLGEGQQITMGGPPAPKVDKLISEITGTGPRIGMELVQEPKFEQAPIYTAKIKIPGEPALPGFDKALSIGALSAIQTGWETGVIDAPKIDLGMKPIIKTRPMMKQEPIMRLQPMMRIEPMMRQEPVMRTEPVMRLEPKLQPILMPRMRLEPKLRLEPKPRPKPKPVPEPRITPIWSLGPRKFYRPKKIKKYKLPTYRRRLRYTPTVLGVEYAKYAPELGLPKAPKVVGPQAIGIRMPVLGKLFAPKKKRKVDRKARRRYQKDFMFKLGL